MDELAQFQAEIHDGFLANFQANSCADHRFEALFFRFEFLSAKREGKNSVIARVVGRNHTRRACFLAFYGDGCARNDGAGGV